MVGTHSDHLGVLVWSNSVFVKKNFFWAFCSILVIHSRLPNYMHLEKPFSKVCLLSSKGTSTIHTFCILNLSPSFDSRHTWVHDHTSYCTDSLTAKIMISSAHFFFHFLFVLHLFSLTWDYRFYESKLVASSTFAMFGYFRVLTVPTECSL